jgi:hypothetical protein
MIQSDTRVRLCLSVAMVMLANTGFVQEARSSNDADAAEVALALSACPATVASSATVYLLRPNGYVKARSGTNGFTAVVEHSLPKCMDTEAARVRLPRIMMVARLRAEGKKLEDIDQAVNAALASGELTPARHTAVDYMLSPQNQVTLDQKKGISGPFPGHIMILAPYLKNLDVGSDGTPASPMFVVNEGTPYAMMIIPAASQGAAGH